MRVFITGATGFIGRYVLRELFKKGHEVKALTRGKSEKKYPEDLINDISLVDCSATDHEALAEAMQGCDAVVNLIGIVREFRFSGITFDNAHVRVTKALVDGAKKAGVERFVQMSALGAACDAKSRYHKTKFEAEEYVIRQDIKYTVFRPSIVFGPGDSFVSTLAGLIQTMPVFPLIGTGEARMQPVYVDVMAKGIVQALGMPKSVGKVYEVGGTHKIQFKQIVNIIAQVLGKKILVVNQPRFMAGVLACMFEDIPFFPFSRDQLNMSESDSVCKDVKNSFNEDFKISQVGFKEGLEQYLTQTP